VKTGSSFAGVQVLVCAGELTLGFLDQSIADSPLFNSADPDRATGSGGPRTCPGESPMIFDAPTIQFEPVDLHHHIGEGGHESLRGRIDRGSADGGHASIDGATPRSAKCAATLAAF